MSAELAPPCGWPGTVPPAMGGTHSRPTRVGPHDDGVSGASKTSLGGAWSWRRREHSSPTSVTSLPSPAEAADAPVPPAESWYSALLRQLLNGKPAIDEPTTAVADFGAGGDSFSEREFLASAASAADGNDVTLVGELCWRRRHDHAPPSEVLEGPLTPSS